ncbi:BTB/POZ and MATH domain-containing protein 3-like [Ananas comosus]|uniref:BTB/POZ and MATH domain-containing protein 3-like n=1 Tax=Ananas comosus TaxID=4615 RepID=A0A6P5GX81_ANACO|nr:BTB/POZ and MATH domain-containing protein 3-like [Ananas comosus]
MATSVMPCNETSSSCHLTKARGSHQFKIFGFSLTEWMASHEHIESATFNVGGYDWAIQCFPCRWSQSIAIYVMLKSNATNVKAVCELTLLDQSGKPSAIKTLQSNRTIFNSQGGRDRWGYDYFIKRSELANYTKDDCFTVQCTVTVLKPLHMKQGRA